MTSHTPNDLVARLRGLLANHDGGHVLVEKSLLADTILALTSQQHTEPVAGEVEVVAWLGRRGATKTDPLVRKSSYDALAAAKDREIADARESEEHATDCFKEANARIQALERQRDALQGDFGLVRSELIRAWAEQDPEGKYEAAHARAEGRFNKMMNTFHDTLDALKDEGSAT